MAATTDTIVRSPIDPARLVSWYRRNRERSRAIFDCLADEAYYLRPIDLRHPIVFYEGHLPAFSFNTLVKRGFGGRSVEPAYETLFARGIDPHEEDRSRPAVGWPDRDAVRRFSEEADRRVTEALERADLDRPGDPLLDGAQAAYAILEHEAMHQETLLYMWHRLPFDLKRQPADYAPVVAGEPPRQEWIEVPAGRATLGVDPRAIPFGWDNEFPATTEEVGAFRINRHDVTNAEYLEFVEAGGYRDPRWWRDEDWAWVEKDRIAHPLFWETESEPEGPHHGGHWWWRGMFQLIPLPLAWPVYVSHAEASAFARWRGARLPSEAEFQRAAYGRPAEAAALPRYPWGDAEPTAERGVFDFTSWEPGPAGSHPHGRSAWGIDDLVGNGWEWTSTPFRPFPGFRPMASYPEYSADFFDGEHFVMKGASPATARDLLRPSFRNWFRARYPYVYATFRCAKDIR